MPTYTYRRDDGTTFDVFQRITDPALTADPETGRPVERVISGGAGLQFKGSGFYLTDYARAPGGGSKPGESTSGESKPGEPKADTSGSKADAAPAKAAPAAKTDG